jgi:ADP-heptose:LPS heptosyltransferase
MTGLPPVAPPKRILVSRLRQIGDVILTLPLVEALRDAFPEAAIDYLAEASPAQAVVGHPAVRTILGSPPRGGWPLPAPWSVLSALRRANYDWVFDLYGNPRSALLAAWTGAPVRVGPHRRGRRHLYTHPIPPVREPLSAVEHHLRALAVVGVKAAPRAPRIHLTDAEREFGRSVLSVKLPGSGPAVGLHVGNRWPSKRWPEERFASLVRVLSKQGVRVAVLAGPGEEALAGRIQRAAPQGVAALVAGLALRPYWAVLASLDVLVTNDGSPLHAGPAVGTPTVGILGPTVPEIWFPYEARAGHQLLCKEIWCRPCHRHECARLDCLDWITVDEARRAVERALARGKERRDVA